MPETLLSLQQALVAFVNAVQTQSQEHIKPLHRHLVQRLVIEGGFRPEDLSPRPPLRVDVRKDGRKVSYHLEFDPDAAESAEHTILGGVKTKDVDIVVSQRQVGPSLAISVKGTGKAFRNLTNRMEEAAGDCTNVHMAYPALVYGFLHVLRATPCNAETHPNDVAVEADGQVVNSIHRYHSAMEKLAGRRDLRNELSRYEAVAIALVHPQGDKIGTINCEYPPATSPLSFDRFLPQIYRDYDHRFVYSAPNLAKYTERLVWSETSEVIARARNLGFEPRTE
jgi:hypothetical protein